ncbi:MAG TPA: hypothetical protein VJ816_09850 [Gemmatimonadales bacterium]|nr:hypothetical protein [Gemmatimonadales bacterium]
MKHLFAKLPAGVAALITFGGCGDSSGPGGGGGVGGTLTARATDPVGDTYGVDSVQWDLTALTVVRDTGGITVVLDIATNVVSPVAGDTFATYSFVDFDTDQNATTGISSIVDDNRPGTGSTGMGVDFWIDLANYGSDSTVHVVNAAGSVTGTVRPIINGAMITARIPRSMLGGDDGFLNAAAIVGTVIEPTDIIPEDGHLKVGGTGPVAPVSSSAIYARRAAARRPWRRP